MRSAAAPTGPGEDAADGARLATARTLTRGRSDAVVAVDGDGRIALANRRAEQLFGYEPAALIGLSLDALVIARTRAHERLLQTYVTHATGRRTGGARRMHGRRRDGAEFPIDISLGVAETPQGPMVTAVIGDPADGFDHAQELQRMVAQAGAIAALADAALEGTTLEALQRRTVETVRAVLAVEHASVLTPDPDTAGIALSAGSGWPPALIGQTLIRLRMGGAPGLELTGLTGLGVRSSTAAWIEHDGRRVGVLAAHSDRPRTFWPDERRFLGLAAGVLGRAGERHARDGRVREQALHDPLTGLANRSLFVERLEQRLSQSPRAEPRVAVMFLDLDGFKGVNDSLGHAAGDQVLRIVGERLAGAVRGNTTVARLGGDEFAILLDGLGFGRDAFVVAARVLRALQEPIRLGTRDVTVSASIGVSLATTRAPRSERMLRDADAAMYAAKAAGRGGIRIFDRRMHAAATQRLRMERALQDAIAGDEFTLVYQPVVRVDDESPAGFEALLRWRRADRVLAPAGFLALAEETALIVPLGSRAVQLACVQCAAWQRAAPDHPAARVSVNLSARELADPGLAGRIAAALSAAGLDASRLAVEVHEQLLAADLAEIDGTLGELRELGVDLVVDGFGASGAALGRICRRPLAGLKLDRGSVKDLHRIAERRAIVAAVLAMTSQLGIELTAVGVQSAREHDVLRELGCDLAQGHRFARPLAPDAVTRLLTHRAPVQSTIANATRSTPGTGDQSRSGTRRNPRRS